MPYRAYRCQLCKKNDTWFSAPVTDQGKRNLIEHMRDEHGETYTMEDL